MKHKLQTLLKHKLQWLLLLAALLGVSQGVWATWYVRGSFPNHSWDTYYALDANNSVTIALNAGNYEFKLDNGSWSDGCAKKNDNASCGSECSIQWNNGGNIGFSAPQNGNYTFTFNLSSSPSVTITCPSPTLYLRGIGGNWNADASSLMSESSGVYTITKSLTKGDGEVFKICGSNWGDHEFGKGTGNPSCGSNYTMGNNGNVSFTPTTSGTHTFTFTLSSGVLNITCPAPSCTTPVTKPVISAGSSSITLDASSKTTSLSISSGDTGDTYLWSIESNPNSGASLNSTIVASPTVTFTKPGTYTFKVGVKCSSDANYLYSDEKSVTVSARDMYIKHNWGGVLDPWTWQKMTWNQSLMAWTYSGSYSGTSCGSCPGCNINTSGSDGGSWYDGNTVTVVNSPSQGDECIYKFTPKSSDYSATDGGAVVITGSVKHTITGAVNTANGGSVSPTSSSKAEGETVSFTATPSTGYEVEKWMVGDSKVADNVTSYTYTVGAADATVTVYFKCKTPTISYNMTGGGLYCSNAVAIGISGSQDGYKYKLYRTASPDVLVDTQTGGGSAVAFTAQSTAGTYYVKVMPGTGCSETAITGNPTSVTITAGTHPDKDYFSVSDNDLTYNGTAQQATVESYDTGVYNPASITVKYGSSSGTSDKTDADDYGIYVTAASAVGNFCAVTSAIELDDDLTIAPVTPTNDNKTTLFTITGVPTTVTYEEGVSHPASVAWKSPYSCTGEMTIYYKKGDAAATTTAPVNAGTYAVTVSVAAGTNNNASASPISLGDIVINKENQSTVSITNAGIFCVGSEVTALATGGSGTGSYSFARVSGTSGITINTSTGAITASNAGTITVNATRAGDANYNPSAASSNVTFTFSEGPAKFTLTAAGGTTICSSGGKLRLSGSESGFSYQLYKNGSAYGSPVAGTGSAIEFDVFESGDYVCRAYLTSSPSCYTVMTGEVTLHISLTPTLIPATPTVTSYTPVTITSINTDILTWEISGEGNTAYLYDKTSNTVKVKASAAGSPYTITATTSGGCSQTATLTVNADVEKCD